MVHNYSEQEAEFEVVTDIPNSSGSNSIKVPANQALPYELRVFALLSGISSRTIHFINKADKSFTWYSVQMHVKAPPAESSIDMSVEVRKALDFEINLVNPTTNKVLVYRVRFDGLGLKGDSTIELQPSESKKYVLKYAPMISQSSKGMIRFSNDELGEFWYELNLVAIESPPITLPEMTSPLGKSSIQTVTLVNPLNKTVEVTVNVSNKRDFGVIRYKNGKWECEWKISYYLSLSIST